MTIPLFGSPFTSLTQPLLILSDEQAAPTVGAAALRRPSYPGLDLDWLDLLAAGLTVGKPDFLAALAHPPHAALDAQRRIALLLGHLMSERMHDGTVGLVRTPVYEHSDPTEKGAVAYNISMAVTLCFARARLGIGYLTHVDVHFGNVTGRRPDLVDATNERSFIEVKGASGAAQVAQMSTALDQLRANRLGIRPRHVDMASCTGFRRGRRDPAPRLGLHVQHLVAPPSTPAPTSDHALRALAHELAGDQLLAVFGPVALYVTAIATGLLRAPDEPGADDDRPGVWTVPVGEAEYAIAFDPYLRRFIGVEVDTYLRTMAAVKEREVSFETHDLRPARGNNLRFADLSFEARGALVFSVETVPATRHR